MRRHELRDDQGRLIAILDLVEGDGDHAMIQLAADVDGSSYRLRIFPSKRDAATTSRAAA